MMMMPDLCYLCSLCLKLSMSWGELPTTFPIPSLHWIGFLFGPSFLQWPCPLSGDGLLSREVTDASDLKGVPPPRSARAPAILSRQEEEEEEEEGDQCRPEENPRL